MSGVLCQLYFDCVKGFVKSECGGGGGLLVCFELDIYPQACCRSRCEKMIMSQVAGEFLGEAVT